MVLSNENEKRYSIGYNRMIHGIYTPLYVPKAETRRERQDIVVYNTMMKDFYMKILGVGGGWVFSVYYNTEKASIVFGYYGKEGK